MLKVIARLEHAVGNRLYHLVCDQDSPLQEVKEALYQFTKYIGNVEDAQKSKEIAAQPEEPKPAAEPSPEPSQEG